MLKHIFIDNTFKYSYSIYIDLVHVKPSFEPVKHFCSVHLRVNVFVNSLFVWSGLAILSTSFKCKIDTRVGYLKGGDPRNLPEVGIGYGL